MRLKAGGLQMAAVLLGLMAPGLADELTVTFDRMIGHYPRSGRAHCFSINSDPNTMASCYDPAGNLYVAGEAYAAGCQKFDQELNVLWTAGSSWTPCSIVSDGEWVYSLDYRGLAIPVSDARTGRPAGSIPLPPGIHSPDHYNRRIYLAADGGKIHHTLGLIFDTHTRQLAGWSAGTAEQKAAYEKLKNDFLAPVTREVVFPPGTVPGLDGQKMPGLVNPKNGDIAVVNHLFIALFSRELQLKHLIESDRSVGAGGFSMDRAGNVYARGKQYDFIGKWVANRVGGLEDAQGNIYVAEGDLIRKYAADGKLATNSPAGWLPKHGFQGDGGPAGPVCGGLAIHQGDLYFSSTFERKVKKVKLDQFPAAGPSDVLVDLAQPTGIAFDDQGGFYVALQAVHRLRKYDTAREPWTVSWEIGTVPAWGKAQFCYPKGLAAQGQHLFSADWNNCRVKIYDLNGQLEYILGTPGSAGEYCFLRPAAVIARNMQGTLYLVVADDGNQRILRYKITLRN